MTAPSKRRRRPRSRARRRVSAAVRLMAALTVVGLLYTAAVPGTWASAEDAASRSAAAAEGQRLYETSCITCHGPNAQGVPDPGRASSASGRRRSSSRSRPAHALASQEAQGVRKHPQFTGRGRQTGRTSRNRRWPEAARREPARGADIARGGELYGSTAPPATPSAAVAARSLRQKAPTLANASDRDIYAAMLTGTQNMPCSGNSSPEEKRDNRRYGRPHARAGPGGGHGPLRAVRKAWQSSWWHRRAGMTTVWIVGKS